MYDFCSNLTKNNHNFTHYFTVCLFCMCVYVCCVWLCVYRLRCVCVCCVLCLWEERETCTTRKSNTHIFTNKATVRVNGIKCNRCVYFNLICVLCNVFIKIYILYIYLRHYGLWFMFLRDYVLCVMCHIFTL